MAQVEQSQDSLHTGHSSEMQHLVSCVHNKSRWSTDALGCNYHRTEASKLPGPRRFRAFLFPGSVVGGD